MRRYNQLSMYLVFLIVLWSCNNQRRSEAPNILILYPDQWRVQALGFMNDEPVITPNLDRLSTESMIITQAVSNFPICSPTRASLMTGKYPAQHGVWSNCNSESAVFGYELGEGEVTWSDILKQEGYATGYIGKWHLDSPYKPYINCHNNEGEVKWNEWCPPSRRHGFDYWYAYGTYDEHNRPLYWDNKADRNGFHYVDQWGPEHEADLAIEFIKNKNEIREDGKPFALMVAMNPPHMPYEAVPDRYLSFYDSSTLDELTQRPNIPMKGTQWGDYYRSKIRNYYAMMTGVDDQIGRILSALEDAGQAENTIVIFSSDHGNCLGIHDQISKDNHYEESMRVPLMIKWPGRVAIGSDDILFSTADFFPSLLGLLRIENKIDQSITGKNYASIFLGEETERPTSQLYIHTDPGFPNAGRRGVRTQNYTMMMSSGGNGVDSVMLHNNRADPYQLINIYKEKPFLVDSLVIELKNWLIKTNDPWLVNLEN